MGLFTTPIPSQAGRTVVVTGGNSGLGYHTCMELGRAGARVIVVSRDAKRGADAVDGLRKAVPAGNFALELCDVSSLASIRAFVLRLPEREITVVDTLINNAGVMMLPTRELSADGFELQIATNHLGAFALTGLLLPFLQRSESPRVVNVSSVMGWLGGHFGGTWTQDHIDFRHDGGYSSAGVYSESKLANQLFTRAMARRYPNIVIVAAHPGASSTNLTAYAFNNSLGAVNNVFRLLMQSAANGARPTLRAATNPTQKSGSYVAPLLSLWGPATGGIFTPLSGNEKMQDLFWQKSVEATQVRF